MVSTRLQSNSNSSSDNAVVSSTSSSSTSESGPSSSKAVGCVTRSNATVNAFQMANHFRDMHMKSNPPGLTDLPTEVFQKIMSYCGFKWIANMRGVNRKTNEICGAMLNSTFAKLQGTMLTRFHNIKAQMPRRESVRRQHPLATEFDIIETIYMRLNLLHMTFGKHIEKKLMYFFPGEVLDEVFRIFYYIKVTPKLPRPYRVTDELFDLTTMAMEHFREKLEPNLPEVTYHGSDLMTYSPSMAGTPSGGMAKLNHFSETNSNADAQYGTDDDSNQSYPPQSNMVLRKRIRKIKQGMKIYNSQLTTMKRDFNRYKTRMADQEKILKEFSKRMDEFDLKEEEMSRKYSHLLQVELNKCKTELQYWRSKWPFNPMCTNCGEPVGVPPVEDLQALQNQGIVIHDLGIDEPVPDVEEAILKNEPEEPNTDEQQQIVAVSGKHENAFEAKEPIDKSSSSSACEDALEGTSSGGNSKNGPARNRRPEKRKQITDNKQKSKRPRGFLTLRSKTIPIK